MGNMASQRDKKRGQVACVVRVSPETVDAGADITLYGEVSCAPACDLRGRNILIKDHAGVDAGAVRLTRFDGKTNETDDFSVKAPIQPGRYTWTAMCPAVVIEGVSYGEATSQISFAVKPHTTSVVVWDVPSAVAIGESFRPKIGCKCSSECQLADRDFGVYDQNGTRVANGSLSGDLWPGTSLYSAEVELQAPAAEGLYTWSVKCPGWDAEIPHGEGSTSFGVQVVGRPAYVVKIETVDKISQTPLSGAYVVMHPYRAITDEHGIAELRVARGTYKLFVSQSSYLTFDLPLDVTADVTAKAELDVEPVTERN